MLNQEQPHIPEQCNKDGHQYLPEMAALFFEGLTHGPDDAQTRAAWPNLLNSDRSTNEAILPIGGDGESSGARTVPNDKLRIFIGGLSNCFNNIFMGIWGNASLIHLNMDASESIRKGVWKIERLIHHGSVLIHIILGYLAEDHTVVRHIRLTQLLQAINDASLSNDGVPDSKTIKNCMPWVSSLSNPARLSRSISRVIEKLLYWVEKEHRRVLTQVSADDAIRRRLMKMDAIIKRGFALTEQLRQYAGDTPVIMRRIRMKSLIRHTLNQYELSRYGIYLETDLSTPLPDILANRSQLSNVLKHLIANAIDAMPKGGRLNIAAHMLSKERSQEKRFARSGVAYLVITVSDSGEGIPSQVQPRIFDPFYANGRKTNHLGLGLSVASGIVKAHGGYIQVSSYQGKGSTFRIYLPGPFKNRSNGNVGRTGNCRQGHHRIQAASHTAQGHAHLPIS